MEPLIKVSCEFRLDLHFDSWCAEIVTTSDLVCRDVPWCAWGRGWQALQVVD
jgi:hypothetical protein